MESLKLLKDMLGSKGALNWAVSIAFLLNLPLFFGFDRLFSEVLVTAVLPDEIIKELVLYLSVATFPIFVAGPVSRVYFTSTFRRNAILGDVEQFRAARFPNRLMWSCELLSWAAGRIFAGLVLVGNLFQDTISVVAAEAVSAQFSWGYIALLFALATALISLIRSLSYCFVYWKTNEADKALACAFGLDDR